jgi:hypothetical protein
MSEISRAPRLVEQVVDMLVQINSLRIRLADGTEHYVLAPDTDGKTWHVHKSLLKALKAKEVLK